MRGTMTGRGQGVPGRCWTMYQKFKGHWSMSKILGAFQDPLVVGYHDFGESSGCTCEGRQDGYWERWRTRACTKQLTGSFCQVAQGSFLAILRDACSRVGQQDGWRVLGTSGARHVGRCIGLQGTKMPGLGSHENTGGWGVAWTGSRIKAWIG